MTSSIIGKIDEALQNDNFETRQGLRFMATIIKDAFQVLDEITDDKAKSIQRLNDLSKTLDDFITKQEKLEARADAERTKWRWVLITPMVTYAVIELTKWIFNGR